ncbi:MAG: hypothetical protein AAFU71_16165 [Cyanobacteria bacterium J06632_22]
MLFLVFLFVVILEPLIVVAAVCLGLGGIGAVVWSRHRARSAEAVRSPWPPKRFRKRRTLPYVVLLLTLLCLVVVPILVAEKVPRHIALRQAIPEFEQIVVQSDPSPIAQVGRYPIKAIVRDQQGGIYFKTGELIRGGWLDPDLRTSYGVVYQPDPADSPFGNQAYQLWPITDDWYEFKATDAF